MKIKCRNCEKKIKAAFVFCPNCGQKAKDQLTLGLLFYNTINNYFSVDARFFKSFFPLLFLPGHLPKKFIEGKRLLYLHPAQFYLFVSVVFFFIFSFKAREYTQQVDRVLKKSLETNQALEFKSNPKDTVGVATLTQSNLPFASEKTTVNFEKTASKNTPILNLGFSTKKLDSLISIDAPEAKLLKVLGMKTNAGYFEKLVYKQILKFKKNSGNGVLQAFFDSIPIALFILLPIFAFILKILFKRSGSFPYHLVFSFYYFSFLFILLGLLLFVNYFWKTPDWINRFIGISTFGYLFMAIKQFYKQSYFLSLFKSGVVIFVYLIFVIPIALGIMISASFLYY